MYIIQICRYDVASKRFFFYFTQCFKQIIYNLQYRTFVRTILRLSDKLQGTF